MLTTEADASYCEPIDGGLYPNLLQIPIVLLAVAIPAAIKRRCCESPLTRRHRKVWVFDVCRIASTTTISWLVLLIFARGLAAQGDACSTLLVLAATDLTLGSLLDAAVCWLMFLGGMRLGFYGDPPQRRAYAAQTLSWMLISVATRSAACCVATLGIGAAADAEVKLQFYRPEYFYYMTTLLPGGYYMLRFVSLDDVSAFSAGYQRVRPAATATEMPTRNPVHVVRGSSSSDEELATSPGRREEVRHRTASPETPCG